MTIFFIILIIIILIAAAFVFLPVPVHIRLVNGKFSLKICNFPYINRRKKQTSSNEYVDESYKKSIPVTFKDISFRVSCARKLYSDTKSELKLLLKKLLKTADVVYYRIVFTIGLDDPMDTGMSIGITSSFFTELSYFFTRLLKPGRSSYLSAVPNFNEKGINYVAELKLRISIFNIICFLKEISKYRQNNQEVINNILGGK